MAPSCLLHPASHGYEDAYPTIVTLHELKYGVVSSRQLKQFREEGGLKLTVYLTIDAESVYKSVTSRDLETPAEKTLLGHILWLRELLQLRLIESIQWCDTRDMAADGHTKGTIDRALLLDLMRGKQIYRHEVKRHTPHRALLLLVKVGCHLTLTSYLSASDLEH